MYGYTKYDQLGERQYDVILHHLVAQHVIRSDLTEQLSRLVKSIAPRGIFCMQFSECDCGDVTQEAAYKGYRCYTLDEIKEIFHPYVFTYHKIRDIGTFWPGFIHHYVKAQMG